MKNLALKLVAIMEQAHNIPKTGYNAFHKYKYVKEQDVADFIRTELVKFGVMIIPSVKTVNAVPHNQELTIVTLDYRIIDTESGEDITLTWAGAGQDKGDKGLYKAFTGAHKYLYMKLFNIGTDDDPENEQIDTRTGEITPKQAAPAPQSVQAGGYRQGQVLQGQQGSAVVESIQQQSLPAPRTQSWGSFRYKYNIGAKQDAETVRLRVMAKNGGARFNGRKNKDGSINESGDNLWYSNTWHEELRALASANASALPGPQVELEDDLPDAPTGILDPNI